MTQGDYEGQELVVIKIQRKDLELFRKLLERERAYTWLMGTLTSWWIWTIAGGVITLLALYDKIHTMLFGTVK